MGTAQAGLGGNLGFRIQGSGLGVWRVRGLGVRASGLRLRLCFRFRALVLGPRQWGLGFGAHFCLGSLMAFVLWQLSLPGSRKLLGTY